MGGGEWTAHENEASWVQESSRMVPGLRRSSTSTTATAMQHPDAGKEQKKSILPDDGLTLLDFVRNQNGLQQKHVSMYDQNSSLAGRKVFVEVRYHRRQASAFL